MSRMSQTGFVFRSWVRRYPRDAIVAKEPLTRSRASGSPWVSIPLHEKGIYIVIADKSGMLFVPDEFSSSFKSVSGLSSSLRCDSKLNLSVPPCAQEPSRSKLDVSCNSLSNGLIDRKRANFKLWRVTEK